MVAPNLDADRTSTGADRFFGASSGLISAVIHLVLLVVLALLVIPVGRGMSTPLVMTLGPDGDAPQPLFTLDRQQTELTDQTSSQLEEVEAIRPLETLQPLPVVDPLEKSSDAQALASLSTELSTSLGGDEGKTGDAMFFGTSASGRDFIFILDISGSMVARDGQRFFRARDELVDSIMRLRPEQNFYVYLFNWSTIPMFGPDDPGQLVPANAENVAKLRAWLYTITPHSGTDPRTALIGAMSMQPSAIFLLSDGRFNMPRTPTALLGFNNPAVSVYDVVGHPDMPKVQINTIAFEDVTASQGMSRLAEMTDGQFRFVPAPGQENVAGPIDRANFISGPDYEPATEAERVAMAESILLLRRAERLRAKNLTKHAKNLVSDIDPMKLPKDARARLYNLLQN